MLNSFDLTYGKNQSVEYNRLPNPYTGIFTNETILLQTSLGLAADDIQAIYNEQTRRILFLIDYESNSMFGHENWMVIVEFDTMKINPKKKQIEATPNLNAWELFIL
ncbi:unnamed protein product [Adineta steineri]|uniref:Uncharacterized protein n=1 Tax=Adineta steineri TaxID=433720 RepID=A0A813RRM6_9BILA|nr:unnamed protein product [Adineta steineri]CAF3678569.1 unnamed protein product [Adineta steineri]CAF4271556.1 unnamed protein product [Adineta steineri]